MAICWKLSLSDWLMPGKAKAKIFYVTDVTNHRCTFALYRYRLWAGCHLWTGACVPLWSLTEFCQRYLHVWSACGLYGRPGILIPAGEEFRLERGTTLVLRCFVPRLRLRCLKETIYSGTSLQTNHVQTTGKQHFGNQFSVFTDILEVLTYKAF